MHRLAAGTLALALLGACSGQDGSTTPPRESASGEAVRPPDAPASLLDSANRVAGRGDTVRARALLTEAQAAAASNPAMTFRVGVAQERLGDIGGAARAYRRYLSIAPGGTDTGAVYARLLGLVGGTRTERGSADVVAAAPPPPTATPAESASVAAPPARRVPRAQVAASRPSGRASGRAATASEARSGTRSEARAAGRRVARAGGNAATPRRTDVAAAPTPGVASTPTSVAVTAPVAPTSAGTVAAPETTVVAVAPNDARLPATGGDTTLVEKPKVHYTRWSRMQYWFVTKIAALGGTGGAVVGAIIGNVPGALALGAAGGAAGGLAKVHQDKVDSARAIKDGRIAGRVVHLVRDTVAGEVDLRPDSLLTAPTDSVRRDPSSW